MGLLDENRLFPIESSARTLARALYDTVKDAPIVSPHGHTDPRWFALNDAFPDPAQLFVTPDHYVFRMLHSQGIALEDLGVPRADGGAVEADGRKIWRRFAEHYHLFRATPSRMWLDHAFETVFGLTETDRGVGRTFKSPLVFLSASAEQRELHWKDAGFPGRLAALSADEKSSLVAEGLLTTDGMADGDVRPAWSVSTSFVRTQTFPPGVPITVEHRYRPMQGGTVASALDRDGRGQPLHPDTEYAARYCVDEAFLRGYDRKRYRADGSVNDAVLPLENWIGYSLSPGANWRGPIGRFRLTVDKGYPDRLVSLCMDGLKKISPTRFEVIKTDYEPTRDLDVLFVALIPAEGGQ